MFLIYLLLIGSIATAIISEKQILSTESAELIPITVSDRKIKTQNLKR